MFILRAAIAVILGVMLRRLYLLYRPSTKAEAGQRPESRGDTTMGQADRGYDDLTEQGIDDADFEEIP